MLTHHSITVLASIALVFALAQCVKVRFLSRCHFGVLGASALRWKLRLWSLMRKRCAIVAFDIRKMHDGNEVFGYSTMNGWVGDLVQVRLRPGRNRDIIGQVGGDEFVIAVADASAGELVIARLIGRMAEITEWMPAEQRAALTSRTNGLVDGLCAAFVLIPDTRNAYRAAVQAVDAVGKIKAGIVTGNRSTSGTAGTQIVTLRGAA